MEQINKICVIGGSGTGKTTLTNNLSKMLNIPVYHLDGINYLPEWKAQDIQKRDKIILEIVKKDSWIIDGTYQSTLQKRLEECDIVIYLDYSTLTQIKGILSRYFKNQGKEREDIPGCVEHLTLSFLIRVIKSKKEKRKNIISAIDKIDKEKVLIFNNRHALHKWYKLKFNIKYQY